MKGHYLKRTLAAALALMIVSGGMPLQPLADIFGSVAVTASAEDSIIEVSSWPGLVSALQSGGNIKLSNDLKAKRNDASYGKLEVPEGVNVTLDLAGHTIDRNIDVEGGNTLNSCAALYVSGNLVLNDSGEAGTIMGGSEINGCGGICILENGFVTMNGGYITGNTAIYEGGGGVYVSEGSTFVMNGGCIYDNRAAGIDAAGGGVVVAEGGVFIMNGGEIYGNEAPTGKNAVVAGTFYIRNGLDVSDVDTVWDGEIKKFSTANVNTTGKGSITVEKGEISVGEAAYYAEGETVTLTVKANDGYELKSLTVNGNAADKVDNTHYSFTMPAEDVTIKADFSYSSAHFSPNDNTYTINDAAGWELFCECLQDSSYNGFKGKTVKLGADITVTEMAGDNTHAFEGTFDGQGHTLTYNVDRTTNNYAAPFSYLNGTESSHAAIKDLNVKTSMEDYGYIYVAGLVALHKGYVDITDCTADLSLQAYGSDGDPLDIYPAGLVSWSNGYLNISGCKVTGSITTNGKYAAGYVGAAQGTVNIENSVSSISITCFGAFNGYHSGFIACQQSNDSSITIKGCLFNGKLLSTSGTKGCAGFIGWRHNMATKIYDSIFDPAEITVSSNGSSAFAINEVSTYNCFYMNSFFDPSFAPRDPRDSEPTGRYLNGKEPHTIIAGENVAIDYGTPKNIYNVSGITSYGTGLNYKDTFYAGSNDKVSFKISYTGEMPEDSFVNYSASTGSFYGDSLRMSYNDDVTINGTPVRENECYFDQKTKTLYLHGNVSKEDVKNYSKVAQNVAVIAGAVLPEDSSELFKGFSKLESVDLRGADTSNVTNMSYMFSGTKITSFDLTVIDTSNVTDMSNMFSSCHYLTSVDLTGIDTSNVTDMSNLFSGCLYLTSVDLTDIDTSNVTDMSEMFSFCPALTSVDFTGIDTSNVTDMSEMFYFCSALTSLDLSGFDTGNVTNMSSMFNGCSALTSLDLSGFDTGNVTNINNMFNAAENLETIYVGKNWVLDNVSSLKDVFKNCTKLTGGNGTKCDGTTEGTLGKEYAVIDKEGQPGYLTGLYTLTLPENMEIVTDSVENKVGSRYLDGAVITFRAKEGFNAVGVSDGTDTLEPGMNGVYTVTVRDDVTVTAEVREQTDISSAVITLDKNSFEYDGNKKNVTFTVKIDDTVLTEGEDFCFEGDASATNAGVYIIKAVGIGAYKGTAQTTWKIAPPAITVTINGEAIKQTYSYNKSLTVTAPEAEAGYKFSHWEVNDNAVSYSATYSFIVKESVDLIPVYVADAEEVEEQSVLTLKTSKGIYNGKNAIQYTFTHSIPEGYTVKEVGLLYGTNKLMGADTSMANYAYVNLQTETSYGVADVVETIKTRSTVKKFVANYKKNNGTITFSYSLGTNVTAYANAIGYIKVVNAEGKTETLYSNFVATNYNNA